MTPVSRTLNIVMLLALATIWGSSFLFIKIAVTTVPPLTMTAGRLLLGAGILWLVAMARGARMPRTPGLWGRFALIGAFSNGIPFVLIGWGEQRIDSGLAAVLMAVSPLVALVLAHFFTTGDRLNANKLAGVALGFVGVLVLVGVDALSRLGADVWAQLAVSAAALCYAISAILARRLPQQPPGVAATATVLCAAAMITPLALVLDRPWTLAPSPGGLAAVAVLGVFPTALAALIYFRLIQRVGVSFVVTSNYLVPVVGVLAGALVLGERLGWRALAALALVLAGIALGQWRRRPAKMSDRGEMG